MKIYYDGVLQNIPEWLTVDSVSGGEKLSTEEVNDRPGEVFVSAVQKAKTFSCSGVVLASSAAKVDEEVSRLANILQGKELSFYRDDLSPIFHKVRLAGDIKYTHYNGRNIGRSFRLAFTLKALDPLGFSDGTTKTLAYGNNAVAVTGNENTTPTLIIPGPGTYNGILLSANGRAVEVTQGVTISAGKFLVYDGEKLMVDNIDRTDILTNISLIAPFRLVPGSQTVWSAGGASLSFNPRWT